MKEIKNVVILGGGTAGWLAAYIMSDFFYSNKLNANVNISVFETRPLSKEYLWISNEKYKKSQQSKIIIKENDIYPDW